MPPQDFISRKKRYLLLFLGFAMIFCGAIFYIIDMKSGTPRHYALIFMGVTGLFWLVSSLTAQAKFDGDYWTFRPVQSTDCTICTKVKIRISDNELLKIDFPKYKKRRKNPALLITYYDRGKEKIVRVSTNLVLSKELAQRFYQFHPDKLGDEALKYMEVEMREI